MRVKNTPGSGYTIGGGKFKVRLMSNQKFLKILILGLIILQFQSCANKSPNSKPNNLDFDKVHNPSARYNNSKDFKQFIGYTGTIDVVVIDVDFKTSISYRQELFNMGLKLNAIEIPFHCTPIILSDTLALITTPRLYFPDSKALVVIRYEQGIFNFSNGGDNTDLFLLKSNDKIEIHASLANEKILYEIRNNPFRITNKSSSQYASGIYLLDYQGIIDEKLNVTETHKVRYINNIKYRIEDFNGCD
jgi:hypothetical protein